MAQQPRRVRVEAPATADFVINNAGINEWAASYEEMKARYERKREEPEEKPVNTSGKSKKVGLAYPAFFGRLKAIYPEIKVIENPKQVKNYDLVIFSGGEDISPKLYNEENAMCYGVNPERDRIEKDILVQAYEQDKKILGICRGHQFIAAILGGKLYQDFGSARNDDGEFYPHHNSPHLLEFNTRNSVIYRFFKNVPVSSLHHQAVRQMPYSVNWTCMHKGIIEGYESEKIIGVQFHPEFDYIPGNAAANFMNFLAYEW